MSDDAALLHAGDLLSFNVCMCGDGAGCAGLTGAGTEANVGLECPPASVCSRGPCIVVFVGAQGGGAAGGGGGASPAVPRGVDADVWERLSEAQKADLELDIDNLVRSYSELGLEEDNPALKIAISGAVKGALRLAETKKRSDAAIAEERKRSDAAIAETTAVLRRS